MSRRPQELCVRVNGKEYRFRDATEVTLGRDPSADIPSANPLVSRRHAVVRLTSGGWVLEDAGSTGGTYRGDEKISRVSIGPSLTVRLGDPAKGDHCEFVVGDQRVAVAPQEPPKVGTEPPTRPPAGDGGRPSVGAARLGRLSGVYRTDAATRLRIGRDPDNDVVVDDMLVSRHHAELVGHTGVGWEIVDVGSHNGTFVDGHRVAKAWVTPDSVIGLGRQQFRLVDGTLEQYEDVGDVTFEAVGLCVTTGEGRKLLNEVTFALPEKALLGIVGPSGAGKSTLMKALTGFQPATEGTVLYNGRDLYDALEELGPRIGYVPQDDILHPQLTVRRALEFAAELRFPSDTSAEERTRAVTGVMAELGLSERADLPIHKLSGGQRKRASVALELLTKPTLLFLDEPTTGLDPGFEKSVMQLLRELADGGRTVIVVTHSLQSLDLCDRVIFLAPGGATAFFGPPHEALDYFRGEDYADVFQALEMERERDWKGQFEASPAHQSYVSRPAAGARRAQPVAAGAPGRTAGRSWLGQVSTLVRRYVAVIAADRGVLAALVGIAPALGIMLYEVLGTGGFDRAFAPSPVDPKVKLPATNLGTLNVVFGLTFCMALIGTANSFREICKELPIYKRERSVGLSVSAYVTSKVLVLVPLTMLQAVALVLIAIVHQHGPKVATFFQAWPPGELVFDVALTGVAAMALGLVISAIADSSDKATPFLAGLLAVQLLLAGALFDLRDRPGMREMSYATATKWGFGAAASSTNLEFLAVNKCHRPPNQSCDADWRHKRSAWEKNLAGLAAVSVLSFVATAVLLRRRDPKLPKRQ